MPKPPKTIADQIALLQSRNMAFRNLPDAPHFLSNISYYRLKGYWWEMQDNQVSHHFRNGSFFEDAIDLYNFDRHFRLIYHMSLAHGAEWYLNPALFDKQKEFASFVAKIYSDMSRSSEEFIVKHFQNHPTEHPESWKALEVLTLGTLSKLYQNIGHQMPQKSHIASEFGLNNQKYLASWLITITLIRNIIAHHGRLWNRVIINKYDWPPNSARPLLSYLPNNNQRRKIFPILSAILYLNNEVSPGHHVKSELKQLFQNFPNTPLTRMGFPANWQNEPIWQ